MTRRWTWKITWNSVRLSLEECSGVTGFSSDLLRDIWFITETCRHEFLQYHPNGSAVFFLWNYQCYRIISTLHGGNDHISHQTGSSENHHRLKSALVGTNMLVPMGDSTHLIFEQPLATFFAASRGHQLTEKDQFSWSWTCIFRRVSWEKVGEALFHL